MLGLLLTTQAAVKHLSEGASIINIGSVASRVTPPNSACYLVQMKAAIARNDLINLNHRTTVWIASYADILFAVNRRYHPGEKRLLTYMADLPSRPEGALEDITKLCSFAGSLSSPIVEHVSLMLKRLDEWLNRAGPGN